MSFPTRIVLNKINKTYSGKILLSVSIILCIVPLLYIYNIPFNVQCVYSFGFASMISMMLLCSSQNLDEYEEKNTPNIEHSERLADATIVCFYIFLHGREKKKITCLI